MGQGSWRPEGIRRLDDQMIVDQLVGRLQTGNGRQQVEAGTVLDPVGAVDQFFERDVYRVISRTEGNRVAAVAGGENQ